MSRKRSFAPVTDANTRTLILGSLPGEASLAQSQYYAHPQNKFWELLSAVVGEDLRALDYEARLTALLKQGVGLWDVVAEAQRKGSLDSAIREHSHNDLVAFIDTLPELHTVAFNGATAAKIGMKALGARAQQYRILLLPSSSAAHASLSLSQKLLTWRELRK